MKKREYGDGSIYQRKDGLWVATFEAGYTPTGKRHRIIRTSKQRKKALEKIKQAKIDYATKGIDAFITTPSVATWTEKWLTQKTDEVTPKVLGDYRSKIYKWTLPRIGNIPLDRLTPQHLKTIELDILKNGLSAQTAHAVFRATRTMLNDAVRNGYNVPQSVLHATPPAKGKNTRTAIPTQDAIKLLEVASTFDNASRWVAALLSGMRQGECLGLRWEDVDFSDRFITVSWQLQALPYDKTTGGFTYPAGKEYIHLTGAYHLVRPKTLAGQRIIPLVPWFATALLTWKKHAPKSPYGLVWPREDGGPLPKKTDAKEWKRLQDLAGVSKPDGSYYVLHEARHTTATLLMEAGIAEPVITAIMGHSDFASTQNYTHANAQQMLTAMSSVAGMLKIS